MLNFRFRIVRLSRDFSAFGLDTNRWLLFGILIKNTCMNHFGNINTLAHCLCYQLRCGFSEIDMLTKKYVVNANQCHILGSMKLEKVGVSFDDMLLSTGRWWMRNNVPMLETCKSFANKFEWCNIFFFSSEKKKVFASVCCQELEVRKFWAYLVNSLNCNKSAVRL